MNVNNKLKYKTEELTTNFLKKSVITDVSSDMTETIYQVIIITPLSLYLEPLLSFGCNIEHNIF